MKDIDYYINKFKDIDSDTTLPIKMINIEQYDKIKKDNINNYDENLNINCNNCINCYCCTNCDNCVNCLGCVNCNNCVNSSESINCKKCFKALTCDDCINCYDVSWCVNCINCNNCNYCNNCTNCEDCDIYFDDYESEFVNKNLNYCINCINCIDCNECKDCFDCTKCTKCFNVKMCSDCYECRNIHNKTDTEALDSKTYNKLINFNYRIEYDLKLILSYDKYFKIPKSQHLTDFIVRLSNLYSDTFNSFGDIIIDDEYILRNLKIPNVFSKFKDGSLNSNSIQSFNDLIKLLNMIEELYKIDSNNNLIKSLVADFEYLKIIPVLKQLKYSCPELIKYEIELDESDSTESLEELK